MKSQQVESCDHACVPVFQVPDRSDWWAGMIICLLRDGAKPAVWLTSRMEDSTPLQQQLKASYRFSWSVFTLQSQSYFIKKHQSASSGAASNYRGPLPGADFFPSRRHRLCFKSPNPRQWPFDPLRAGLASNRWHTSASLISQVDFFFF